MRRVAVATLPTGFIGNPVRAFVGVTIPLLAAAVLFASPAHGDPLTRGELDWVNHMRDVLGIHIIDMQAVAHAGRTICRISYVGADTDTTISMMYEYVDSQFSGLSEIQRSAVVASALRLVCP